MLPGSIRTVNARRDLLDDRRDTLRTGVTEARAEVESEAALPAVDGLQLLGATAAARPLERPVYPGRTA
jgi:hypothetical protein